MWRGGQSAMDPRLGLSARVEMPLLNLSTLCRPAESDLTARVSCHPADFDARLNHVVLVLGPNSNADENETQKVQAYQMSGNCLGVIRLDCLGLASAKRAETFGCKVSYCAR
ncbi:unnamed protein product [Sphagnum jensenii]|uniref:Uncharacterized protein n=1 Tax=Sphagnum jensenii TaxID=128206 RepID=A0ABP1BGX2_9BRYO